MMSPLQTVSLLGEANASAPAAPAGPPVILSQWPPHFCVYLVNEDTQYSLIEGFTSQYMQRLQVQTAVF